MRDMPVYRLIGNVNSLFVRQAVDLREGLAPVKRGVVFYNFNYL